MSLPNLPWDNVVETPTMSIGILITASGKKKLYQKGWDDAVDGNHQRYIHPSYIDGWNQGKMDLEAN